MRSLCGLHCLTRGGVFRSELTIDTKVYEPEVLYKSLWAEVCDGGLAQSKIPLTLVLLAYSLDPKQYPPLILAWWGVTQVSEEDTV